MIENKYCVYRHRRLDTFEVFYIGIGDVKRPYYKYNRNKWWTNITNKTSYEIEIITKNLDWETACELEEFLIQEYGRKNLNLGPLVNLTNGGEGAKGLILSKEQKKILSEYAKQRIGNKNPFYGRKHSDETIKHLKESQQGEKSWKFGKKESESTRLKKSISQSRGKGSAAKKVIHTETNQIWDCLKDAAEELNYNYSTLKGWMKNIHRNKSKLKYLNE